MADFIHYYYSRLNSFNYSSQW